MVEREHVDAHLIFLVSRQRPVLEYIDARLHKKLGTGGEFA